MNALVCYSQVQNSDILVHVLNKLFPIPFLFSVANLSFVTVKCDVTISSFAWQHCNARW